MSNLFPKAQNKMKNKTICATIHQCDFPYPHAVNDNIDLLRQRGPPCNDKACSMMKKKKKKKT